MPRSISKPCWLALLILTVTGIAIRTMGANEPAWLDECHTAWAVDTDLISVVAGRAADGNQPPFFFVLTWCITQFFGLSEFSLRIISLVCGSLLIPITAIWAKSLTHRDAAAILVAALITFDGQFIYYSTEARPYAMVQLLGLLQAICFWSFLAAADRPESLTPANNILQGASDAKNLQRGKAPILDAPDIARAILLLLLSIALLYTHYTSLWILVAESVIVLGVAIYKRELPIAWFGFICLVAASFVPLWWNVSMVFERRSNWSSVSSTGQLWSDYEPWLVHWILIPAAFAIAGFLLSVIKPRIPSRATAPRSLWVWILVWALLGPIAIGVIDVLGIAPMALERYAIVCWVAIAVFAGMSVSVYQPRTSWLVAGLIFGSSLFGNWWVAESIRVGGFTPFRVEDWATPVSQIAEIESSKTAAHQPIFQFADVIEDIDALSINDARFQNYLLFPTLGAEAISGFRISQTNALIPMATLNPVFTAEHLDSIRSAKGCWLIVRGVREFSLVFPGELEIWLGEPIEFKEIPNPNMPYSNVHLLRVRIAPESLVSELSP